MNRNWMKFMLSFERTPQNSLKGDWDFKIISINCHKTLETGII
jgi:hypothetical protein